MKSIIVECQDEEAYHQIEATFQSSCTVQRTLEKNGALDLLQKRRFDLVFIDLNVLNNKDFEENYRELLLPFWQIHPSVEIIVMAPQSMIRNAVQAVKAGANDYLTYPLDAEEIKLVSETINKTKMMQSELDYLRDQFWLVDSFEILRTNSDRMRKVFQQIRSVSPT